MSGNEIRRKIKKIQIKELKVRNEIKEFNRDWLIFFLSGKKSW